MVGDWAKAWEAIAENKIEASKILCIRGTNMCNKLQILVDLIPILLCWKWVRCPHGDLGHEAAVVHLQYRFDGVCYFCCS